MAIKIGLFDLAREEIARAVARGWRPRSSLWDKIIDRAKLRHHKTTPLPFIPDTDTGKEDGML